MTAHPPVSATRCPTGCGRTVRRGQFMCADHWHAVPAPRRQVMRRTWAAFMDGTGTYEAFEQARADALAGLS